MNNNNPYSYTPMAPPPADRPTNKHNRWTPLFDNLRANNPDEWVKLDTPMSQSDAQYLVRVAKSVTQKDEHVNIEVSLRTHSILDEKYANGINKRLFNVYVRVCPVGGTP